MTILLVDDSRAIRTKLRLLLEESGHTDVLAVSSGEEAVEVIGRSDPPIDLVLLDQVLPGIGGTEACRRIKAMPQGENIPVVFVTGSPNPRTIEEAFAAGAIDFVAKPPRRIELLARIRAALALKLETEQRLRRELELWDMAERLAKANQQLQQLSTIDALSGIPNRRSFDERLLHEWRRAGREGRPVALALVDIDNFKRINDRHGHVVGDRCIQAVAEAMSGVARRPADFVARYGGEEFAMILPETDGEGAAGRGEALRQAIADLAIAMEGTDIVLRITASVGVACFRPPPSTTPEKLLVATDVALYAAKHAGKNRVVLDEAAWSFERARATTFPPPDGSVIAAE